MKTLSYLIIPSLIAALFVAWAPNGIADDRRFQKHDNPSHKSSNAPRDRKWAHGNVARHAERRDHRRSERSSHHWREERHKSRDRWIGHRVDRHTERRIERRNSRRDYLSRPTYSRRHVIPRHHKHWRDTRRVHRDWRYSRDYYRPYHHSSFYRKYHYGFRLHNLPSGYFSLYVGSVPYYYHAGTFFRHYYDGYIVVSAPLGARVHVLPYGYLDFYLGHRHYFFINETYYLYDNLNDDYVVVSKPDNAPENLAQAETDLTIYPRHAQTEEQQQEDRYQCHLWAVDETHYDPVYPSQNWEERDDYWRAISACLEGRGYVVK